MPEHCTICDRPEGSSVDNHDDLGLCFRLHSSAELTQAQLDFARCTARMVDWRARAKQFEAMLWELLLAGEHNGVCDNAGPKQSCSLHVMAFEARRKAIEDVLTKWSQSAAPKAA